MPRRTFVSVIARYRRQLGAAVSAASIAVPIASHAQAVAPAQVHVITIATRFPPLRAQQVVDIPASTVDAAKITAITASPEGTIVLAEPGEAHLILFDARGQNRRTVGRRGAGPGDIKIITGLGWLGRDLAVLDANLKRIDLFTMPDGRLANTISWPPGGSWPEALLNGGDALFAIMSHTTGEVIHNALGGYRDVREYGLTPVTIQGVGAPILGIGDTTPRGPSMDCGDKSGYIYIIPPVFVTDRPLRAVGVQHEFISADPGTFSLTLLHPDSHDVVNIRVAVTPVPMTTASWDSVTAPIRTLAAAHGAIECDPPVVRPATWPVVRELATDDSGIIWVHATTTNGSAIYGIKTDGTPKGVFRMPARADPSVPWYVRAGRLYLVTVDDDGLQGVQVYDIRP